LVCWQYGFRLRLTLFLSLLFCSTPDYITPEMPQVANEFDDDKVGKRWYFFFLLCVSAVTLCCPESWLLILIPLTVMLVLCRRTSHAPNLLRSQRILGARDTELVSETSTPQAEYSSIGMWNLFCHNIQSSNCC
jgi:hypothetical protein